jgi:hypothetical protein
VGPENLTERIAGEHFCMFLSELGIRIFGETNDGVGSTNALAVCDAVQAGASQASLTGQNIDAVAAEPLFDSVAVKE